jgi:hypothetical protein
MDINLINKLQEDIFSPVTSDDIIQRKEEIAKARAADIQKMKDRLAKFGVIIRTDLKDDGFDFIHGVVDIKTWVVAFGDRDRFITCLNEESANRIAEAINSEVGKGQTIDVVANPKHREKAWVRGGLRSVDMDILLEDSYFDGL